MTTRVEKSSRANAETFAVQSCITNVSFPETPEDLEAMIEDNDYLREGATDIDTLLEFEVEHDRTWTAPRWMSTGDVLFFHHTAKAETRINRLTREVSSGSAFGHLKAVLEHARAQAARYSRTIFGCALVSGESHFERDEDERQHFRSHIYAPLGIVHIFDHPLLDRVFRKFLTLSPGGTLTPLHGAQFKELKEALARQNALPQFLRRAEPGKGGFRSVSRENWLQVSCAPECRFIDESQLRAYLLDFLLAELKDSRTPLLEECDCFRKEARTGIADYFMKVGGSWMPVEAKLNASAERRLEEQVKKYTRIDHFVPRKGPNSGQRFDTPRLRHCLVIDQSGVYLLADGRYIECQAGEPIWRRDRFSKQLISEIRSYLTGLS